MWKKIILSVLAVFIAMPVFAHPGRVDGSGGHRVNKEYIYEGRYVAIKDGRKYAEEGKVKFEPGDYHYHIHWKHIPNFIVNGIIIPVSDKEVKNVQTKYIHLSDENVVASKHSDKYHRSDCHYAQKIKEDNAIIFEDFEDAENSEYIPCKRCKPNEVIK